MVNYQSPPSPPSPVLPQSIRNTTNFQQHHASFLPQPLSSCLYHRYKRIARLVLLNIFAVEGEVKHALKSSFCVFSTPKNKPLSQLHPNFSATLASYAFASPTDYNTTTRYLESFGKSPQSERFLDIFLTKNHSAPFPTITIPTSLTSTTTHATTLRTRLLCGQACS